MGVALIVNGKSISSVVCGLPIVAKPLCHISLESPRNYLSDDASKSVLGLTV